MNKELRDKIIVAVACTAITGVAVWAVTTTKSTLNDAFVSAVAAKTVANDGFRLNVLTAMSTDKDKRFVGPAGPSGATGPAGPIGPGDDHAIPVGGVVAFWGASRDIPKNYEVCDGELVHTDGPINGKRKPNLFGRFIQGAIKDTPTVVSDAPAVGGRNTLDLRHSHAAGGLYAELEVTGGYLKWNQVKNAGADHKLLAGGVGNPETNGGKLGSGIQVSGKTDGGPADWDKIDNRPECLSLYYIIRVK